MSCVFCKKSTTDGKAICNSRECRIKVELSCVKDHVVQELRKSHSTLLIYLAWVTLHSIRRGMIFVPSPFYFRRSKDPEKCDFDQIVPVIKNIFTDLDKIKGFCSESRNDQELRKEIGDDAYCLIKFILISQVHKLELMESPVRTSLSKVPISRIQVYKITTHPRREEEFSKLCQKGVRSLLYHGSATENWHSILRNGIKNCSNTSMMTAGAVSGSGVYLSSQCATSHGYSWPGASSTSGLFPNGSAFPRILGIVQIAQDKGMYNVGASTYVVKDDREVLLRYIVVFYEATPKEIDDYLRIQGITIG